MFKMQACRKHWESGVSWADTGIFDYVLGVGSARGRPLDGCRTYGDVRARYLELDRIFETVQLEGRLRTKRELPGNSFREAGGIFLHFGRTGAPLFGGGGTHRLAIAKILGLRIVPAQVGVVHEDAVQLWRNHLCPPPA
jgi:hypothetical protein